MWWKNSAKTTKPNKTCQYCRHEIENNFSNRYSNWYLLRLFGKCCHETRTNQSTAQKCVVYVEKGIINVSKQLGRFGRRTREYTWAYGKISTHFPLKATKTFVHRRTSCTEYFYSKKYEIGDILGHFFDRQQPPTFSYFDNQCNKNISFLSSFFYFLRTFTYLVTRCFRYRTSTEGKPLSHQPRLR